MSQELIEAVARAMYERDCLGKTKWSFLPDHMTGQLKANARAALAAIEASGFVVVPANDEVTFVGDMDVVDWLKNIEADPGLASHKFVMQSAVSEINRYRDMLSARPKVTT